MSPFSSTFLSIYYSLLALNRSTTMASVLGLPLQATFAFGARQRWGRVGLWPAPASNDPLKKACVLPLTPRLSRGRVRSSWASGPPEGPSVERKAITARRKAAKVAGLQALAVAAACAVGASLCLSRRAAAMPDPIATATAAAAANREEVPAGKTEVLLREIMFGGKEPCEVHEDACKKLFGHAFGLLPRDNKLRLLQQIISQGKITDANIQPHDHEKYEMQIAIVQIHMAMNAYHEAKKVLGSLDAIGSDYRIPLLEAVLDMMFALETLLTESTTEYEVAEYLITRAKESWREYYKLKKEGLGPKPPNC